MQGVAGTLRVRTLALLAIEHVLIIVAVFTAVLMRFGLEAALFEHGYALLWRASLIGVVLQICLHYADLYDFRTLNDRRELMVGLIQALGAASLVLALLYYWLPNLIV